jgi:pantoate--beta-alanine ligase
MRIVRTKDEISKTVKNAHDNGRIVGFVPTLGALHDGHLSLIHRALKQCDHVVCSVFVNPTQFNDPRDLEAYPRQLKEDASLLEDSGCHTLFTPSIETVYPDNKSVEYDLGGLDQVLEGPLRPGHFDGVVNVVGRLFELVQPDMAFFGKKDRQQLAIIQHVSKQYSTQVDIIGCPTIREPDGLAMSSRNSLLSSDERQRAVALYKALCLAEEDAFALPLDSIRSHCARVLERHGLIPEYFDIVHPDTLQSLSSMVGLDNAIAITAAYCGNVRLIDNIDLYR